MTYVPLKAIITNKKYRYHNFMYVGIEINELLEKWVYNFEFKG